MQTVIVLNVTTNPQLTADGYVMLLQTVTVTVAQLQSVTITRVPLATQVPLVTWVSLVTQVPFATWGLLVKLRPVKVIQVTKLHHSYSLNLGLTNNLRRNLVITLILLNLLITLILLQQPDLTNCFHPQSQPQAL